MTAAGDLRRELAEFLKTRRHRLSPAELGLPAGGRRRTAGLRREEVAALAGIGLTWYTWLEQGKAIQVSTSFLENLARSLRLTSAERSHLFALAQHRLPPLANAAAPAATNDALQALLDAIDAPTYARDQRFDVVAWNEANTRMFGDFAVFPPHERNVLRLMFARNYHRRTVPNWEEDARRLLAKFRMHLGQAAEPAPFHALVAELAALSADFRRLWAEHEVSDAGEGITRFLSPRDGAMRFRHQTLIPEAWPELRLIVFVAQKS
jgi:transcriptional regulator with XRE-family HTH domain